MGVWGEPPWDSDDYGELEDMNDSYGQRGSGRKSKPIVLMMFGGRRTR